jgi:hypothetical protein
MSSSTVTSVRPVAPGALARAGATGIAAGIVLVAAVRLLAGALLPIEGLDPYAWGPILGSVVVFGVAATVVYALLDRLVARPRRWFLGLAALVFLGMLVPVFLVGPSLGADTLGLQAGLIVLHVAAAGGIAGGVLRSLDRTA